MHRTLIMAAACFVGFHGVALWGSPGAAGEVADASAGSGDGSGDDLIAGIDREIAFRPGGEGYAWFHPRACVVPGGDGASQVLMTMQRISGSDVFGPVHWTIRRDLNSAWSPPEHIAAIHWRKRDGGLFEGACDFVPQYHAKTATVLAIGHNVFYRDGKLARPQPPRWPVYVVRDQEGRWSDLRKLPWNDARGANIYTSGCAQRLDLPTGDILLPLTFGPKAVKRSVGTVLCSFDGKTLAVKQAGNELKGTVRRGLLEPSLARLGDRYYMTIRAEDDRGYVTVSRDGLNWEPKTAWAWDDGEPLVMSTTQQRWLPHSDALYLVYTRRDKTNTGVMRWRAPLFVARVDPKSLRLVRSSERIVLPLKGDGVRDAKNVPRMGNFHTVAVSPGESWVTTGEANPNAKFRGDTLIARIRWKQPNRAAPGK